VLVLLLFASVATASAECAWVLWMQTEATPRHQTEVHPFEVRGAWPDRGSCNGALRDAVWQFALVASAGTAGDKVASGTDYVHITSSDKEQVRHRWPCLPDSIEPRRAR
jgi:hypothetical protein